MRAADSRPYREEIQTQEVLDMAFQVISREGVLSGDKVQVEIVLDSTADVANLSTDYAPGSLAYVADKGIPLYMLSPSGEWKEM